MPHKPWKLLLSVWATSLSLAIFMLFTLAADTNAQETLRPYAPPILHSFLDSANVYPESVTVDQSSGSFFVGSVKEGTIYKGKIGRASLEVFSPGGADGRSIATGMFFANNRLVVVGRQTGLMFVYNTKTVVSFRSWIMVICNPPAEGKLLTDTPCVQRNEAVYAKWRSNFPVYIAKAK